MLNMSHMRLCYRALFKVITILKPAKCHKTHPVSRSLSRLLLVSLEVKKMAVI